jgi:hypothetical protein
MPFNLEIVFGPPGNRRLHVSNLITLDTPLSILWSGNLCYLVLADREKGADGIDKVLWLLSIDRLQGFVAQLEISAST